MKFFYTILLVTLLLVSCVSNTKSSKLSQSPVDKSLSEKIIGDWISEDKGTYAEIKYFNNNSSKIWWYDSALKRYLIFELEFEWWIEKGLLYNKLEKIIHKAPSISGLEIGEVKKYEISKFTDSILVFIDESGTEHTMLKK